MTIRRNISLSACAVVLGATLIAATAQAQTVVEVAINGEPPTLDPVLYTSDSASTITQHMFETLYTFNAKWEVAPLLAAGMPTIADGGTKITIPLRRDAVFHSGAAMTAEDVEASVKRWTRVSPRGKLAGEAIESIAATGPATIEIKLKQPFAPLLPLLATNNAPAAVMPKAVTGVDTPVTEFIGTGPYKLLERRPAQYTRLVRFDQYKSPSGTPSGYAGERKALIDEIRFLPVSNATTRVSGVISGQYHFAETLPNESFGQIKAAKGIKPVLTEPTWATFVILNNKGGVTANPKIRKAMQAALNPADMLMAGFGDPALFQVDGSVYGKGTAFYDGGNTPGYNKPDPKKAAALLKEAGYKGEPLRLLTSMQFDYFYKQTMVYKQLLEEVGFKVNVEVMDWASVIQKRSNVDQWEGFVSLHPFIPEPSLLTFVSPSYAGWWDTPEKRAALAAFNKEMDPAVRVKLWGRLQELLYDQAATLMIGQFYSLTAISDKLQGYTPTAWPSFWNVSIAK